jgi:hypothetical protein
MGIKVPPKVNIKMLFNILVFYEGILPVSIIIYKYVSRKVKTVR